MRQATLDWSLLLWLVFGANANFIFLLFLLLRWCCRGCCLYIMLLSLRSVVVIAALLLLLSFLLFGCCSCSRCVFHLTFVVTVVVVVVPSSCQQRARACKHARCKDMACKQSTLAPRPVIAVPERGHPYSESDESESLVAACSPQAGLRRTSRPSRSCTPPRL